MNHECRGERNTLEGLNRSASVGNRRRLLNARAGTMQAARFIGRPLFSIIYTLVMPVADH